MPGSVVSTRSMRLAIAFPSRRPRSPDPRAANIQCPHRRRCESKPTMRPAAVFSKAFSSGQSATASRAVFHALGFAERRRHRTAIEVIAPNHDRRFDLPFLHQIIHRQAELRPLAVSQPADARRQSLKLDALARQINPAAQDTILRETTPELDRRSRECPKLHPTARPSGTVRAPRKTADEYMRARIPGKS
jgi:hypothetical protein